MTEPDPGMAYSTFTHKCFDCGGTRTVRNGKGRSHLCRLRWLRRLRWACCAACGQLVRGHNEACPGRAS